MTAIITLSLNCRLAYYCHSVASRFSLVTNSNFVVVSFYQILLSQGDVKTLFRVLFENLQEGSSALQESGTAAGG
jgi:hypothetical protein